MAEQARSRSRSRERTIKGSATKNDTFNQAAELSDFKASKDKPIMTKTEEQPLLSPGEILKISKTHPEQIIANDAPIDEKVYLFGGLKENTEQTHKQTDQPLGILI